jgi:multiple sugar transport system permease protein
MSNVMNQYNKTIEDNSSKMKSFMLCTVSLLIGFIFLLPLFWLILCSIKTEEEIFRVPLVIFPSHLYLQPYMDQLSGYYNMFRSFANSLVISLSTMLLSVILSTPAAYGLARFRFRGRNAIVLSFLVTQMLPASLLLTPLFITFNKLHLYNTFLSPIIADTTIGIPFSVLILRTYILTIPKDLDEAASVDGCNPFKIFVLIIFPNIFPGVVVSAVFSFLFAWGDLIYANTFINKQTLMPLTAGIYNFMGQYGVSWNHVMAFGVVSVIPVLMIFIFMQRYIVSGLTSGSVKG